MSTYGTMRKAGTGIVRKSKRKYEARTAQTREHPRGKLLGKYDTRFRAHQACDRWVEQQRKGAA